MNEHRTVKLRIVPYTGDGTVVIVLMMTDGTSARLTVSLGEWSRALGKPGMDVEASCEMAEQPGPVAA